MTKPKSARKDDRLPRLKPSLAPMPSTLTVHVSPAVLGARLVKLAAMRSECAQHIELREQELEVITRQQEQGDKS